MNESGMLDPENLNKLNNFVTECKNTNEVDSDNESENQFLTENKLINSKVLKNKLENVVNKNKHFHQYERNKKGYFKN